MPARVEELCGLVFVNLDPDATPLADLVGDLPQRLARYRIPTLESFAASGGTASPRTGRWSPTTTSRATTSRSPTRA